MIGFRDPGRLLRTVRHLKPRQIAWQIGNRVRTRLENPASLASHEPPTYPGSRWNRDTTFQPPRQPDYAPDAKRGRFRFLDEERELGSPIDWSAASTPKLWQYNLHYFDWLFSTGFDEGAKAVLDWIERHPPRRGAVGWEPYPVSLRAMNWCGWFFARHAQRTEERDDLDERIWASLWRQLVWLESHIEYHLLANHLLENAAALAIAGSCFHGPDAERWHATGLRLLCGELAEQLLPDGMHYERSPMYHARVCYLLGVLAECGTEDVRRAVREPLRRARAALLRVTHPDGEIALFNDAAFGIAPAPAALGVDVSREKPGPWSLPSAGYYGMRTAEGMYVCIDAAEPGPSYQPGHAHADLFSFEFSVRGHRVFVDSGTFDYVAGPMRRWCRSTRAHNALEIDGQNQSEVWGAFRVGRRAMPRGVQWSAGADGFRLSAWHDGYAHLPGKPVHARQFEFRSEGQLLLIDRIRSSRRHTARRYFHLHPTCRLSLTGPDTAMVRTPVGPVGIRWSDGAGRILKGWYCPGFGERVRSQVLVLQCRTTPESAMRCRITAC